MSSRQDTFGDALRKGIAFRSSFFGNWIDIKSNMGVLYTNQYARSVHPPNNCTNMFSMKFCPNGFKSDLDSHHVLWSQDQEAILGPCERTWSLLCHKSKLMEANCLGNSASLGHAWQVVIHGLSWNCYDQAMPWGFADSRYLEIDILWDIQVNVEWDWRDRAVLGTSHRMSAWHYICM